MMLRVALVALLVSLVSVSAYSDTTSGADTKGTATKSTSTRVAVNSIGTTVVVDAGLANAPVTASTTNTATEADTTTTQPAQSTQKLWQGIVLILAEIAFAIIVPVLGVFVMLLIRKWNLKIEQDKVDWILDKAKGYGEQYMKNKLKSGHEVSAPEVAKVALAQANKLAELYAPKLGGYLSDLIEAKLGQDTIATGGAKKSIETSKEVKMPNPMNSHL